MGILSENGPMAQRHLILAAFLLAASAGCEDRGEKAKPASSAAPSATAVSTSTRAPVRFSVEPFGVAVFVVKVPPDPVSRDIKGVAKGFGGALEIDPYDVSRTRGDVAVDLTTLEAHGFGDERLDAEVTAHARDFLEVGKGSLKEPVRFARFAIKSIDDASERNVMPLPGDKRTVTRKATGDLEIHGVKQEKQVELVASFTVSGETVSRVTVRTAKPIVVSLSGHGIKPRGASGEDITAQALGAAGAAHSDEASVTFELAAKPAGAAISR